VFRNDFLFCRFSIPEIPFSYGITILETSKTVKRNFGIFEECRVQEEKYGGAGRNL